jgi:hypothetical protein
MMMLFFFRGISVAKRESLQRVEQWALQSNEFAAKFAARTLQSEISSLFRMITDEADRRRLLQLVTETVSQDRDYLARVTAGGTQPQEDESFLKSSGRLELEKYLAERLELLARLVPDKHRGALFSSLFLLDAQGNNLGIAFRETPDRMEQNPVGKNFAYRSYFTGQRADLLPTAPRLPPLQHAHFSASFRSTSTGKWKVGISCPIWPNDTEPETGNRQDPANHQPIGVLVLTINLGDFQLLTDQSSEDTHNRLAILVDGRDGNQQGTLLQHPLLSKLSSQASAPRQSMLIPTIDTQQLSYLLAGGLRDYRDPAGQHEQGEEYRGDWIAALAQVELPTFDQTELGQDTDLWVVVQERASRAREPIQQLGNRLQTESMIALGTVVLVICVLWYFVFRLSEVRDFSPSGSVASNALNYPVMKSTVDHD